KEALNIEETLWNYIDGNLSGEQLSFVEEFITNNNEWKAKYSELMEIHQLMQNHIELEVPSMRFTQNVMEEISRQYISPATSSYINKNVIRGIGLFFLISIVGLVLYVFGQVQWASPESKTMSSMDISKIDYGFLLNNTYTSAFMMINLVLALMLVDMYLTKKKTNQIKSKMTH
ncbi:MAG: hypothetical protein ABI415_01580, partial [Flavitalea sp.]